MSADRCRQVRITNSHQQTKPGLKEVRIGAAPYRGAPICTKAAARPITGSLLKAIDRCCRLRGDTDDNRLALRAECLALPVAQQADMAEHFAAEADAWAVATGQAGA